MEKKEETVNSNPQICRTPKLVLSYLALFKRFGYERPYTEEGDAIASLLQRADPLITVNKFNEIVRFLRVQKLLQGETTFYITPKAVHIYMWTQWWDVNGASFDLKTFLNNFTQSPRLIEWFYEMFKYADESDAARRTVRHLLGPEGPFQDDDYLKTQLGSRFFLALTEADPKSALWCLERTVGKWSKEELLNFTTGRRNVIWALEKIAIWRELCPDAARLLLLLGEAENENIGNNASGVFADLFSPGYGRVAPTEASPEERFPVLKEALESESTERRQLGLRWLRYGPRSASLH